ncbi:hypothetical protein Poli38472_013890 [Pythium oligandrum]|uniref:Protein kinase domain-containing protein n=1 Tax=Pythium oligandrum TaxID=41045 RepID=A0A8K1C2A4_PYTOL|nr:hypothetical protein Poli38472_013890 [Pythium oligandrum]|eukprot:TMW55128.1 hypothetical protein Poli38472_013890 [Pythium oligandrum]
MGKVFSRSPVTVSPETHHFQSTIQSGTLVYVALSNQSHKINPLTDSRKIDNHLFFGFNVRFEDILIEDRVGMGNFGVVYKAYYKGKRIALKQLLAQQYNRKTMKDFQNELNILSILTHPNIVQFLGSVMEPPNFCLLTELCAGSVVDLLQLAQTKKINITWGLTLEIAHGCAKACAYLHGLDPIILHRDIKAENLLITESFKCKLSDFGLSRSLHRDANAQTMCGTPRWLAPEVFRGEDYSEKIDIYSYGIVLWELFCFKKPYLDQDPINLAYMVAHEELRPELPDHIPDTLLRLMKQCWEDNPTQRPSFASIIQGIEEAKITVELNLAIDVAKPYEVALHTYRRQSKSPLKPYGLTSGRL